MRHRSETLPRSLYAALRKEAPHTIHFQNNDPCTTIASYNVHKCVGTDGRFDPDRIAAVVGEIDADIIALQEADERLGDRQGLLDLKALERATDLVPVHMPENSRSHGWHGNLILARNRVVEHVRPIRLPGLEPRGALIVDLELKGVFLRIIAAHFGLFRRSRSQQASVVLHATHTVLRPTILLGDLNEWRVKTRSSLLNLLPHFGPIHAVLPSLSAAGARPHPGAAAQPHFLDRSAPDAARPRRLRPFAREGAPEARRNKSNRGATGIRLNS